MHIVVPCTANKRGNPVARLGDINAPTLRERYSEWLNKLHVANFEPWEVRRRKRWRSARRIYRGPTWGKAERLEAIIKARGLETTLHVASAGWGLIDADRPYCETYSATFAAGNTDAVGNTAECRQWWEWLSEMPPRGYLGMGSFETLFAAHPADPVICVLSSSYYSATRFDLIRAIKARVEAAEWDDVDEGPVLIVTSTSIELPPELAAVTVHTSLKMMGALSTNCVCINHDAACWLASRIDLESLDRDEAQSRLNQLISPQQISLFGGA